MDQPNLDEERWDVETHRAKRGHYISDYDIEELVNSHFDDSNPALNDYFAKEVTQDGAKSKVLLAIDTIPAKQVVTDGLSEEAKEILQSRADFLEEVTGLTAKERKEIMEEEVKPD